LKCARLEQCKRTQSPRVDTLDVSHIHFSLINRYFPFLYVPGRRASCNLSAFHFPALEITRWLWHARPADPVIYAPHSYPHLRICIRVNIHFVDIFPKVCVIPGIRHYRCDGFPIRSDNSEATT
jgi:hypothetical protein